MRTLRVSVALADYLAELGWVGAQQVLQVGSRVTHISGPRRGRRGILC